MGFFWAWILKIERTRKLEYKLFHIMSLAAEQSPILNEIVARSCEKILYLPSLKNFGVFCVFICVEVSRCLENSIQVAYFIYKHEI